MGLVDELKAWLEAQGGKKIMGDGEVGPQATDSDGTQLRDDTLITTAASGLDSSADVLSEKSSTPRPHDVEQLAPAADEVPTTPAEELPKQQAPPAIKGGVALVASACGKKAISDIISGTYLPHGSNHGKKVYKKTEKSHGLNVLIYYWEDPDDAELCGWWFGPYVGGDQVWAFHPCRTTLTPPMSEWSVPHDGSIDPNFSVIHSSR